MTAMCTKHSLPVILALATISVLLLAGCTRPGAEDEQPSAELAKDFPIDVYQGGELLGGSSISFKQILEQESRWCSTSGRPSVRPCRAEMPDITEGFRTVPRQGNFLWAGRRPLPVSGHQGPGQASAEDIGYLLPFRQHRVRPGDPRLRHQQHAHHLLHQSQRGDSTQMGGFAQRGKTGGPGGRTSGRMTD